MARYIDADKADVRSIHSSYMGYSSWADVLEWLQSQPTADVEEVKHGKWLKIVKDIGKGRTLTHYKCSLCGVYVSDKVNYCYHCGAKMSVNYKSSKNER